MDIQHIVHSCVGMACDCNCGICVLKERCAWLVIKSMYKAFRSAVLLDGKKSSMFSVEQVVAQNFVAYFFYPFVERSGRGWIRSTTV